MHLIKNNRMNHLQENATIYIFMTILFLTGIIFGSIAVNSMSFIQKQDLYFHLDRYFQQLKDGQVIPNKDIFISSLIGHIKILLLLFILGLSVIGMPIVWIIIFIKGLVIGFSVGFIVNQLGMQGLILATLSIAPQNLIMIPIYIIASSLSMIYSLILFQKLIKRTMSQSILKPFIHYITIFTFLMVGAFVGSLIEAFVANEGFKILLKNLSLTIMYIISY